MSGQLMTNGRLEVHIVGEDSHTEDGRALQTVGGTGGLLATTTLPSTPIEALAPVVVLHPRDATAQPAADLAREQVLAAPLAGRVGPLRGVELLLIDQGGMDAGKTLAAVLRLPEVGTVQADAAHGRVLDADFGGDHRITRTRSAQREDALDQWGHLIGDEFTMS